MTENTSNKKCFEDRRTPRGLLFRLRRWILLFLILSWAAAVIASHIPQETLPELPVNGKILHVLGYFGLASLLALLFASRGKTGMRYGFLALLIMSAYAAFDEGTQPYFHRHGCVSDWLLDTASAASAMVIWYGGISLLRAITRRVRLCRISQRQAMRGMDVSDRLASFEPIPSAGIEPSGKASPIIK